MRGLVAPATSTPQPDTRFTEADLESVPASHAVVAFVHTDGAAFHLLATANAKALARSRLLANDDPSSRADLGELTASLRLWPASCSLEADLLHASLGPVQLGDRFEEHRTATAFAFLAADPSDQFPRLVPRESRDAIEDAHTLIGPFTTRKRAQSFADAIINEYELCREYERLMRAPDATACIYKELGTCPAACDGSESLHAYRARFAEALRFAGDPIGTRATIDREMREAASEQDFERAESSRARLARIDKLIGAPDHLAGDLRAAPWLAVSSVDAGVRVYAALLVGGRVLADALLGRDDKSDECAHRFAELAGRTPSDPPNADTIGALLRRFARPSAADPARLHTLPRNAQPSEIGALIDERRAT